MKAFSLLALAFSSVSALWNKEFTTADLDSLDLTALFSEWKTQFGRGYTSMTEEAHRFSIFTSNLDAIISHNSQDSTYKLKLNQFADLTNDEFVYKVHGKQGSCISMQQKASNKPILKTAVSDKLTDEVDLPDSIDWTDYNGKSYVTPVKNQGDCGSCWSFSTTGAIECRYAIATEQLNSLSEQQLVDCSGSYGNDGCDGGLMDDAFKYVIANKGLCSESDYPYTGEDGTCDTSKCSKTYDAIDSYSDVTIDNENDLMAAVAEGCVSVAIQANQFAFQFYSSGVLTGKCGKSTDHGVLVVGYGTDSGTDYWKVKNSWGSTWGMDGYILICRDCDKNGNDGECGIDTSPSYPVV